MVLKSIQGAAQKKMRLNARAFTSGLNSVRVTYREQLAALLDALRPRIEAGEFIDLGDDDRTTCVKEGSPEHRALPPAAFELVEFEGADEDGWIDTSDGLYLLGMAIERLPIMQNEDFIWAVLFASDHKFARGDFEITASYAAEALAHDVRELFRSQGGKTAAASSSNWRYRDADGARA